MRKLTILLFLSLFIFAGTAFADTDTGLRLEVTVHASRDAVWKAWTTEEGLKFFAPASRVELRPGGLYEIYFDPKAPEGHRGADGNRVMLVQPPSVLAFTWNAPETFPFAREQHTHVMIRLQAISASETRVVLTHDGFGEGADWDKVRAYFRKAWGEVVLPRLVAHFER